MNDTIMNDESTGSAYEKSSDEQDSSLDEGEQAPASRAGSVRIRSRSRGIARGRDSKTRSSDQSNSEGGQAVSPDRKYQNFEDAVQWAANFQPPSFEDIKTPPRGRRAMNSKAHKPASKRKALKPASEIRVKRLKSFYSNEYREMLNEEIQDAKLRANPSGEMKSSQIGSSFWSEAEKMLFFMSLDRLGREDIRGIGEQIGTKSQNQVQEYICLLHKGIMERKEKNYSLLTPSELPAAVEISDECVALLERAGDAIAAHQELAEEKVEKAKWGDSWLITEDVAQLIEKRRSDAAGEEAMEEVLPAANLLHLRMWLELSRQIFMNPAAPRDEDNWEVIAEPGERPAMRATAFEDFHSLTVSITKRIVSSVLYCAMSRLRARSSKTSKYSQITVGDVKAALNILGMKTSSNNFWIGCAKRCSLEIIDGDSTMTYAEVEEALQEELPEGARSRSRSVTRHDQARGTSWNENIYSPSELDTESTGSESEHVYLPGSDEEVMSSPSSSNFPDNHSVQKRRIHPADVEEAAAQAQDAHTEAFDVHASQVEEIRLWNMLDQSAPFEFSAKPVINQAPRPPKDALVERENWREYFDYVSAWEAMGTPVREEEFLRNRTRRSRLVQGRAARNERGRSHEVQRLVGEERGLRLRDDEDDVFAGFEKEQGNGGDERPDSDLELGSLDDQSIASEDAIAAQIQTEKSTASDEQDDFNSSELE